MILTVGAIIKDDQGRQYILDELLGSGGFGSVFKAHRDDGSIYAVKALLPAFNDDKAYLSFKNEIAQSLLVESDNVIKYTYAHDGERYPNLPPYIIMEYANGGTLRDLLDTRQPAFFDMSTLVGYYRQLASGMLAISKNLVHRDIKPENILVADGELKISDFGLSKIAGESTRTLTFKGYGTAKYVAPEAWKNDNNTIQMDIYSMGIVFYELATLQYPYDISSIRDPLGMRDVHLFQTAKAPSAINHDLPANIIAIIMRMMEKSVHRRFNNWEDIIAALEIKDMPQGSMSSLINKAMEHRNEADLNWQKRHATEEKQKTEKQNRIRLVESQYEADILNPIEEFVNGFNAQYAGHGNFSVKKASHFDLSRTVGTTITLPSARQVKIDGEVVFKENYTRERRLDPFFDDGRIVKENYIPQCDGRNVMFWAQVSDYNGLGFNILLLESKDDIYGEWFVLESESNGLSRTNRPSPFGFSLSELPKEIVYLRTLHIYNLRLMPYEREKIIGFLAERA